MRLYNDEPNFSIVMPGSCNCNCSFCFWKEQSADEKYLENLEEALKCLPEDFYQVSITGGEPTLSPYFAEVVSLCSKYFRKIVVTTNGTNLEKYIQLLRNIQWHTNDYHHPVRVYVNISRHHHDESINQEIFGTDSVPDAADLIDLNHQLNKAGIPVNVNCVLTEHMENHIDIIKFINQSKELYFSSVAFRKQHGDLEPSDQERQFDEYVAINEGFCPVCRSKTQLINGVEVYWKSSIAEPVEELPSDMVYELVFHPNTDLTADWKGENYVVYMEDNIYDTSTAADLAKRKLEDLDREDDVFDELSASGYSGRGCHRGGGC